MCAFALGKMTKEGTLLFVFKCFMVPFLSWPICAPCLWLCVVVPFLPQAEAASSSRMTSSTLTSTASAAALRLQVCVMGWGAANMCDSARAYVRGWLGVCWCMLSVSMYPFKRNLCLGVSGHVEYL